MFSSSVRWFALQINCLVPIWWEHWLLKVKVYKFQSIYFPEWVSNLRNWVHTFRTLFSNNSILWTHKNEYTQNFYAKSNTKFVFKVGEMYKFILSRFIVYHTEEVPIFIWNDISFSLFTYISIYSQWKYAVTSNVWSNNILVL